MEIIKTNEPLYIVGDSHGLWDYLFRKLDHNDIKDCYLWSVGDNGIGFLHESKQYRQFEDLNNRLSKRNIKFYSIAGNHDHRSKYFDGSVDMSNFKLIPDYTQIQFNDELFLLVGGAISIDRIYRKLGHSYWDDEAFILNKDKAVKCDVLITHSGPSWIGPFEKDGISSWCDRDHTLWDECVMERKNHNELLKLTRPNRLYLGHFHQSQSVDFDGCYGRILDELEITEHRPRNEQ